ncbi:hypothetical protein M3Y99_00422700 [Aphelenchoides fujianensis]|nr:hypothetical protein M3Y99_00422700 [Aphelenchoides fujianensis]
MNRLAVRGFSTSCRLLGPDAPKGGAGKRTDMFDRLDAAEAKWLREITQNGNMNDLPKNRMVIADHEIESPVYNGVAKRLGYRKSKNGFEQW